MMRPRPLRIGLVGDRDDALVAHRAIPRALDGAARALGVDVQAAWLPTEAIDSPGPLAGMDALWCVPGSPYRSEAGALQAIGHARRTRLPFLGTCGGFQHVVLEWARTGLGWADAAHAESDPAAARTVISLLDCALVEATEEVRLVPGSRLAAAYGAPVAQVTYRCRYGLDPAWREAILGGPLRLAATGLAHEVRGLELEGHPFFVAVLFQPEREALAGHPVPLAEALLRAALDRAQGA